MGDIYLSIYLHCVHLLGNESSGSGWREEGSPFRHSYVTQDGEGSSPHFRTARNFFTTTR